MSTWNVSVWRAVVAAILVTSTSKASAATERMTLNKMKINDIQSCNKTENYFRTIKPNGQKLKIAILRESIEVHCYTDFNHIDIFYSQTLSMCAANK